MWTKKSSKGGKEWKEACIDVELWPQKLKTLVKTRFTSQVILFQEIVEYMNAMINLCYDRQVMYSQACNLMAKLGQLLI